MMITRTALYFLLLNGLALFPLATSEPYCCEGNDFCPFDYQDVCTSASDLILASDCEARGRVRCHGNYCCPPNEPDEHGNECRNRKNMDDCDDLNDFVNNAVYVRDICKYVYYGVTCDGSGFRCCQDGFEPDPDCYTTREFFFFWDCDGGLTCGDTGDYCCDDPESQYWEETCPKNFGQLKKSEVCLKWDDWEDFEPDCYGWGGYIEGI